MTGTPDGTGYMTFGRHETGRFQFDHSITGIQGRFRLWQWGAEVSETLQEPDNFWIDFFRDRVTINYDTDGDLRHLEPYFSTIRDRAFVVLARRVMEGKAPIEPLLDMIQEKFPETGPTINQILEANR